MAENVTPVVLEIKDFAPREVMMVDYKFDQATDRKDFSVKFVNTVDGAAMKEIKGTNCYCVNYVEKWEDGQQHYEEMEIVCQKLENGAVSFDNPWK